VKGNLMDYDYYTRVASWMFCKSEKKITSRERKAAKVWLFCLPFYLDIRDYV